MHHFLTEDVSLDNRPIVDLQRRACWIGIALFLQAINEIDQRSHFSSFAPIGSVLPVGLILGSLVALWMAFRPTPLKQEVQHIRRHPRLWQHISLILTFCTAIAGSILFVFILMLISSAPQLSNDGTSLDTNAATLLLEGRNPYTDSNMLDIARHFPIHPDWTTPLRLGRFTNHLDYPTLSELQAVLDTGLKQGTAPEFESKVSYPALSFLTLVPFALFKDYNVLPFYLLSYLVLVAVAWKVVRPELRPWVLLLAMANVPMWASLVSGNLDIFYTLLLVAAWLLRERRWSSALFLGLAAATKQLAWFFIPFYAIMVFRRHGWKEATSRLIITGSIALIFNLPFIVWNPHAWLAGVLAPIADPMFPLGVGLIAFSTSHLLPYFPTWVYGDMEVGIMLITLFWYWRLCRKHPEAAILLAVLPLFFAWRSLPSYFYCVAYPLFVLLAAKGPQTPETKVLDNAGLQPVDSAQPSLLVAFASLGLHRAISTPLDSSSSS